MEQLNNIYLSSAKTKSGKTEIGIGIALLLQERGYKVAYLKPFGILRGRDRSDPEIKILAKIFNQKEETVCPVYIDKLYFEQVTNNVEKIKEKIMQAYLKLKESSDLVIIEGTQKVNQLMGCDLDDARLSKFLDNSPVLAINSYYNDLDVADILMQKWFLEERDARYLGSILNKVPKIMNVRLQEQCIPLLNKKGVKVFGVVGQDERLSAPTFGEIMSNLNGKLLDDDPSIYDLDVLVESVFVGAMSAHSALSYFRKSKNKLVITGGDRSDIVITALETDVAGIILTGNLYPDLRVISAAREKKVPIILVSYDTFTTANKVNQTVAELQINERLLCKELVQKNVNIDDLISALEK
ncbi:MAG: DRTGG domain-containing protein [Promethearchaeota archaeon]